MDGQTTINRIFTKPVSHINDDLALSSEAGVRVQLANDSIYSRRLRFYHHGLNEDCGRRAIIPLRSFNGQVTTAG